MKRILFLSVAATMLWCNAAKAQEAAQPLVQLKVRSYDALVANARKVATVIGVSTNLDLGKELAGSIGSPNLDGVDRSKPWQAALSLPALGAPPLAYVYVPVTNYERFRTGLLPTSLLRGMGAPNETFQVGQYAVIVLRFGQPGSLIPEEKTKATAWVPPAPAAAAPLVELALELDESARQQALQFVMIGRMGAAQAAAIQNLPAGAPVTGPDLAQMINMYLDIGEIALKGLRRYGVRLDVGESAITIMDTVDPLPGSELAQWLRPATVGVGEMANQLDPKSMVAVAGAVGDNPPFLPMLKKLVRLSFQMQSQPLDEKLANQFDQLMDTLTPVKAIGSVDLANGLSFGGYYEFPGTDAKQAYASIKQFFTNAMPLMTGTNKTYRAYEFKEGARQVGGVSVDRFGLTLNLDTPLLQVPGQKEALEQMWKGGKIEIEYAVKENRIYVGTPEKMAELLASPPRGQAATSFAATPNTVLIGRVNLLTLIKQGLALNPIVPPPLRASFERINPEGGDLRFRIDLDGKFSSRIEVPFKIFEALRQLQPVVPAP